MSLAILAVLACRTGPVVPTVKWRTDLVAAQKEAKKLGKKIFIDFYGKDCTYCVQMDRTTYRTPQVVKWLTKVIPVRLDANDPKNRVAVTAYAVDALPGLRLIDASGMPITAADGYLSKDSLLREFANK